MNWKYDILVKWEQYTREMRPIETIERITTNEKELQLRFEYLNKEYKYVWKSNMSQGLSYLYDWQKCIYDPYKKDNSSEAVALHDAASQLSIILKKEHSIKS